MNNIMSTPVNTLKVNMYTYLNLGCAEMSFSERLVKRMKDVDVKAIEIANRLGVSRGTVSQWVNDIAQPRGANATQLATILRCNINWLMNGKGDPDKLVNTEPGPDLRGKVPLISWIQAGNWLEMDVSQIEHSTHYIHTANVGPRAFALRVIGDSMTSLVGKSIPDGSVVIVDPDITPEHGKVVVARLDDSNEATLKQLVIDGGQKYLKPFNNAYPMMPINGNCTIIGVVKQVVQDF